MKYTNVLRLILQAGLLVPVAVFAADVEVTLKDGLDGNLNGYCLDIKSGTHEQRLSTTASRANSSGESGCSPSQY